MSDEAAERAVFSALLELAKADGAFTPEERARILQAVDEADLDAAEGVPLDHAAMVRTVTNPADRREFVRFALGVSIVDGEISAPELAYLRRLARDFEISAEEFEDLRRSVLTQG